MHNVPVGTQSWKGAKGEKFTFDNDTDGEVKIQKTVGQTFPFKGKHPILVKPHKKKSCQLIDDAGEFLYSTDPAKCSPLGNPKNVIIT